MQIGGVVMNYLTGLKRSVKITFFLSGLIIGLILTFFIACGLMGYSLENSSWPVYFTLPVLLFSAICYPILIILFNFKKGEMAEYKSKKYILIELSTICSTMILPTFYSCRNLANRIIFNSPVRKLINESIKDLEDFSKSLSTILFVATILLAFYIINKFLNRFLVKDETYIEKTLKDMVKQWIYFIVLSSGIIIGCFLSLICLGGFFFAPILPTASIIFEVFVIAVSILYPMLVAFLSFMFKKPKPEKDNFKQAYIVIVTMILPVLFSCYTMSNSVVFDIENVSDNHAISATVAKCYDIRGNLLYSTESFYLPPWPTYSQFVYNEVALRQAEIFRNVLMIILFGAIMLIIYYINNKFIKFYLIKESKKKISQNELSNYETE